MQLLRALRLHTVERPLISIVGGGGKSSLLFRLGEALAAAGRRTILTSSTRLFREQLQRAPMVYRHNGTWASLAAYVRDYFAAHDEPLLVVGALNERNDRVDGLPADWIDRLWTLPAVDAVVVEADGSRNRPFKAPAAHEPVLPSRTTHLLRVVGFSVLGKPLTADHVHRPALVAALSNQALGSPVTAETIRLVLSHPDGGLRHATPAMQRPIIVNQVDDETMLPAARALANSLLAAPGEHTVLLTHLQNAANPVWEVIVPNAAVLLAAGMSKRMGRPKQLLSWHGQPLFLHTLQRVMASEVNYIVLVVGANAARLAETLPAAYKMDTRLQLVVNQDWQQGQATSMQRGLTALPPAVGAALFVLADQPDITPALINALLQRHRETLAPLVVPRWKNRRGNPVLFDRSLFPALARIRGDQGGRALFPGYLDQAAWLEWPDPAIWQDIDTPEDYRAGVR